MQDNAKAEAQQWALQRFAGLSPCQVGTAFRLVSVAGLAAPLGFEPVWKAIPDGPSDAAFAGFLSEGIPALEAVFILFHPLKQKELLCTYQLTEAVHAAFGGNAPPLYWICHTAASEAQPSAGDCGLTLKDLAKISVQCGAEELAKTEASGFRLALELRMMVAKTHHLTSALSSLLNREQYMRDRRARLQDLVHRILWEYLLPKVGHGLIPPIDWNLPADIPRQLNGWFVGKHLGRGFFASVYLLTRPALPDRLKGSRMVVKVLAKSQYKELADVNSLERSIEVMQQLSSTWRHPGLVRLHQVYHAPSHILITMEYGGSQNLFRRLLQRDRNTGEGCRLFPNKARAIITQAVAAVAHMHTGPEICHRDLKPENIVLREEANGPGLVLKLTDFDFATPMRTTLKSPRGSLPFVAPEAILLKQHQGGPADIWSLSIVVLEVLCCTRILERALHLEISAQGEGNRATVASDIAKHFNAEGSTSALLSEYGRPELANLLQTVTPVLQQTLQVNPLHRLDARQLSELLRPETEIPN